MFVIMRKTLATADQAFVKDTIDNLEGPEAEEWTRKGLAVETKEPPGYVKALFSRLDEGDGGPVIFMPFIGEFGHEVMSHMRIVHFHKSPVKVVCCRPGCEVLYPSASEFVTGWEDPVVDAERVGTMRTRGYEWTFIAHDYPRHFPCRGGSQLTSEQEIFAIKPDVRIPFNPKQRGLNVDIVFGVRRRDFMPERNWQHWQTVADAAKAAGLTYAVIGDRYTSDDLKGQECHSGDLDTDAAVELLQNCRLYVGLDSGASHLASTVGAEMLVFREMASGSRDLLPRMQTVNPGRTHILPGGWMHPHRVASEMIGLCETVAAHG